MSKFALFNPKENVFWWESTGVPQLWDTADAAKAFMVRIEGMYGSKTGYVLRPLEGALNLNWLNDELQRQTLNLWNRPDYLGNIESDRTHCLRLNPAVAPGGTGDLLYYKDYMAGMVGKLSAISLRGYMEKFRHSSKWQIDHTETIHKAYASGNDGLLFEDSPAGIARVYEKYSPEAGPVAASCMRHSASYFKSSCSCPVHPAEVYAAGDLAVAYMADSSGRTVARAICWPAKKLYSRVYDSTGYLHTALKKRGFEKSGSYYPEKANQTFDGAKLLRVPYPRSNEAGVFLLPYIDEHLNVYDMGDHLVMSRAIRKDKMLLGSRTINGWSTQNSRPIVSCQHCNNQTDRPYDVYDAAGDNLQWCANCVSQYSWQCQASTRRFTNDVQFIRVDERKVSAWAEAQGDEYIGQCPLLHIPFIKREGVNVYTEFGSRDPTRMICSPRILSHSELIWRDVYGDNQAFLLSVDHEPVMYADRNWYQTSPRRIEDGYCFRSTFNGKLYDIRFERYINDKAGISYRVASLHSKAAAIRLEKGKPIRIGTREGDDPKEED
jgi:hypothetical protein